MFLIDPPWIWAMFLAKVQTRLYTTNDLGKAPPRYYVGRKPTRQKLHSDVIVQT